MNPFHCHKWSEVKPDNFQYCTICGKAKTAPNPCENGHKYTIFGDRHKIITVYKNTHELQTLKCERCGELTTYNLTQGEYTD
jgi:hypothetical protein